MRSTARPHVPAASSMPFLATELASLLGTVRRPGRASGAVAGHRGRRPRCVAAAARAGREDHWRGRSRPVRTRQGDGRRSGRAALLADRPGPGAPRRAVACILSRLPTCTNGRSGPLPARTAFPAKSHRPEVVRWTGCHGTVAGQLQPCHEGRRDRRAAVQRPPGSGFRDLRQERFQRPTTMRSSRRDTPPPSLPRLASSHAATPDCA